MLTVFVFDEKESRREDDLPGVLEGLDDHAMARCSASLWSCSRSPAVNVGSRASQPKLRKLEGRF